MRHQFLLASMSAIALTGSTFAADFAPPRITSVSPAASRIWKLGRAKSRGVHWGTTAMATSSAAKGSIVQSG